jgi:hypothetical protein
MSSSSSRAFSLGWVLLAYFFICGGIVFASIGLIAFRAETPLAPYLAFGIGAAVGGVFAGRASPHRSLVEPAIAGLLVVGSIVALIAGTAIGPVVYAFASESVWRTSILLGASALAGGLLGAALGELTSPPAPSRSTLRWIGLAVLVTAGALFASLVIANVLLVDRVLRDDELLVKLWQESPVFEREDVLRAFFAALAGGAIGGGLITQMAAPSRQLLAVTAGVMVAYAGMFYAILGVTDALDRDALIGVAWITAAAGVLALIGALVGWLLAREFKQR